MSIHTDIHTRNGAVNNSSVLELNRDGLIIQLHQKPHELHCSLQRNEKYRKDGGLLWKKWSLCCS
uniref:Uncharacterized protein n=1 Tax=Rhizophora mucronata TaxID=61149 RepID=A0A2P2KIX8_RHIMU